MAGVSRSMKSPARLSGSAQAAPYQQVRIQILECCVVQQHPHPRIMRRCDIWVCRECETPLRMYNDTEGSVSISGTVQWSCSTRTFGIIWPHHGDVTLPPRALRARIRQDILRPHRQRRKRQSTGGGPGIRLRMRSKGIDRRAAEERCRLRNPRQRDAYQTCLLDLFRRLHEDCNVVADRAEGVMEPPEGFEPPAC